MSSVDEGDADAALIHRFLDGDERAFETLMDKYYARVGRLAARILGDAVAAEDVAQEVFLRAARGFLGFRGDASVLTWLSRITVNLSVTALHRQRAYSSISREAVVSPALGDASAEVELRQRQAAVRAAIDSLPVNYRVAIVLSSVEEFAYHEIAEMLGIPIGTVKSRINAGKQLLRDKLLPVLGTSGVVDTP
jgi:RNA polymerase sigma-70 factor (ECF subfamily)